RRIARLGVGLGEPLGMILEGLANEVRARPLQVREGPARVDAVPLVEELGGGASEGRGADEVPRDVTTTDVAVLNPGFATELHRGREGQIEFTPRVDVEGHELVACVERIGANVVEPVIAEVR